MKKILLVILVVMCGELYGQQVETLSLKARLVETLTPFVRGRDDTASVRLLRKWDAAYVIGMPPTQQISVDSVPLELIRACYSRVASFPQGAQNALSDFSADINAIRVGALDAMLDDVDARFAEVIINERRQGRKYLTNKND